MRFDWIGGVLTAALLLVSCGGGAGNGAPQELAAKVTLLPSTRTLDATWNTRFQVDGSILHFVGDPGLTVRDVFVVADLAYRVEGLTTTAGGVDILTSKPELQEVYKSIILNGTGDIGEMIQRQGLSTSSAARVNAASGRPGQTAISLLGPFIEDRAGFKTARVSVSWSPDRLPNLALTGDLFVAGKITANNYELVWQTGQLQATLITEVIGSVKVAATTTQFAEPAPPVCQSDIEAMARINKFRQLYVTLPVLKNAVEIGIPICGYLQLQAGMEGELVRIQGSAHVEIDLIGGQLPKATITTQSGKAEFLPAGSTVAGLGEEFAPNTRRLSAEGIVGAEASLEISAGGLSAVGITTSAQASVSGSALIPESALGILSFQDLSRNPNACVRADAKLTFSLTSWGRFLRQTGVASHGDKEAPQPDFPRTYGIGCDLRPVFEPKSIELNPGQSHILSLLYQDTITGALVPLSDLSSVAITSDKSTVAAIDSSSASIKVKAISGGIATITARHAISEEVATLNITIKEPVRYCTAAGTYSILCYSDAAKTLLDFSEALLPDKKNYFQNVIEYIDDSVTSAVQAEMSIEVVDGKVTSTQETLFDKVTHQLLIQASYSPSRVSKVVWTYASNGTKSSTTVSCILTDGKLVSGIVEYLTLNNLGAVIESRGEAVSNVAACPTLAQVQATNDIDGTMYPIYQRTFGTP